MRKLILIVALGLVAGACGTDPEDATNGVTPGAVSSMQACEDRTPPAPPTEDGPGESKPQIEIPDGPPPCELVVHDIYVGDGVEAQAGAEITVHYVGVAWSTGEQFDASWDAGRNITFPLAGVIGGWQEGIPGMREGGRRQLIIPPDLGYGATGTGGIAGGETLVFVVDLISVEES